MPEQAALLPRLWRRTPLWARLVGAALTLVAMALLITGWVGANLLRSYLNDQVDQRLATASTHVFRNQLGSPPSAAGSDRLPNPVIYEWIDPSGSVLAVTSGIGAGSVAPDLSGLTASDAASRVNNPYTVTTPSGRWRVLVRRLRDGSTLATITSLGEVDRALGRLWRIELLVGLVVLLALAGLGIVVVRLSLRPLASIEETAEAIGSGDLSRRVPEADPHTEVGRLASALNAMLGQLESAARARSASENQAKESEERMRRFIADASHELRTPLTSIRGFAELHRQRGGANQETDRLVARIESEATRMTGLVEDLLLLARLDQQRPLQLAPVDVVALAKDAAFDLQTLDPGRIVDTSLPLDPIIVHGEAAKLRQMLANLVGNVRTHTPVTAAARIAVRREVVGDRPWAVVEVADEGPGLTADQAAKVFERFYRVDGARGRSQGGVGLGLSIVAALAAAHGGRAEVESAPGAGSTFRLWLPAVVTPPPPRPAAP